MQLADENRIDILRQKALLLERENQRLVSEVLRLRRELLQAKGATTDQLQQDLELLEKKLAEATKEVEAQGANAEEKASRSESSDEEKKEKKKQTGHGPRVQPHLQVQDVVHDVDDADKKCSTCGGDVNYFGEDVTTEVEIIVREFVLKKHRRRKYRCTCGTCSGIEMAPMPPRLVPGGHYSNNFAIETATMKYVDQIPFDRIARIFGREGVIVDSQTLWDQTFALGRLLKPGWLRLREEAFKEPVIGIDQSHWKRITKKYDQMWQISTRRISFFDILETKSHADGSELLKGYKGTVIADAFSTHAALERSTGIILAHCWAHPFREAEKVQTSDQPRAEKVLEFIGKLYKIDQAAAGDLERLRAARNDQSRVVVDDLYKWIGEQRVLPSTPIAKLLSYLKNHRTGFVRFLDDPLVPLDNNLTERGYLWPAIGRRSFIGSRSKRGAETASIFYSLAESSRRNDLEPRAYLRIAVDAALNGRTIPLPHELKAP